ncbi:MAG: DEAD/DEAH box helicase family protein, partial [Desulfobacteraceae bacterium]|nr:DEAD/DEAH box helicase family protein [Desulfobacteraceae bacterium]
MQFRKHQSECQRVIDGIIAGSGVTDIFFHVVPGGGKSLIPLQAGKLILAGLADKLFWICPRMTLQDQGERNFIDPVFRQTLGYSLAIRSTTNEENLSRGTAGGISTYQALAVDKFKTVLRDFRRYRYILILDEWHHLAEEGDWTQPIRELYDASPFHVFLTGTLSRGDQDKVAFVPYRQ